MIDPEAEFRADPDWPESETVRGREAVWDILVSITAAWEAPVPMVEVIDAGEDRLVARFAGAVRGKASGVETEFDYWVVGRSAGEKFSANSGSRIARAPSKPRG